MFASTPRELAAAATPRPWFPVEDVTTPLEAMSAGRLKILFDAPRNLNDPQSSYLRRTCQSVDPVARFLDQREEVG